MGLLTRIKAAALFGCLLFASQSFAADYHWEYMGQGVHFSSAAAACPKSIGPYNGQPTTFERLQWYGETSADCLYRWHPEASLITNGTVSRYGDSCPSGATYNSQTGACDKGNEYEPGDKCDDQTGGTPSNPMIWDDTVNKCVQFTDAKGDAPCEHMKSKGGSGTAFTVAGNLDSGGQAVAPPTFADKTISCEMQTISSSECTINVAGAISCNVIATLTGKADSTGSVDAADAQCPDGKCPVKEPETKTKEEGCSPVGNGSGGSTCTQVKETNQEGSQQCGLVNGAYKCFTKPPYSNGINTNISSTSQTLPDGSVKVTTVKESTNTVCTDVKSCTTQTSTTTTHTTTKPNGSTTTDSSCKGACTPNGGGLETNPGAGSGKPTTGNGNGGNGDGEGGEGTASTTDSCTAVVPCQGDPFSCAIVQQAHIDTCKLMAPPTAEQQAAADAKVNQAFADLDAHQSALDQQANTLLGQFQSATGGSGGSGKCLPDFNFSVLGMTQTMEFSKVCDSISWVRLMVLAGAYLFAARIVSREI